MRNKVAIILLLSLFGIGKANAQAKKQFKDAPDTAVFTTTYVTEDNKPITYVSHDADDGAWQFFSDDDIEDFEKVATVVSLKSMVERDNTILQLADMKKGYYATRKSAKDKWVIQKQEE